VFDINISTFPHYELTSHLSMSNTTVIKILDDKQVVCFLNVQSSWRFRSFSAFIVIVNNDTL